jgi:hypothetical protein
MSDTFTLTRAELESAFAAWHRQKQEDADEKGRDEIGSLLDVPEEEFAKVSADWLIWFLHKEPEAP